MSKGEVFWLVFVIAVLFGGFVSWPRETPLSPRFVFGGNVVIWILIFLLGWAQFGFVVH